MPFARKEHKAADRQYEDNEKLAMLHGIGLRGGAQRRRCAPSIELRASLPASSVAVFVVPQNWDSPYWSGIWRGRLQVAKEINVRDEL